MVALAAAAVAWLAVSYSGTQELERGQALADRHQPGTLTSARMSAAVDDLDLGRRFSADGAYLLTEGALRLAAGRRREAADIAREATEREPDNLDAWLFAYAASEGGVRRRQIRREIARLNPWAAGL